MGKAGWFAVGSLGANIWQAYQNSVLKERIVALQATVNSYVEALRARANEILGLRQEVGALSARLKSEEAAREKANAEAVAARTERDAERAGHAHAKAALAAVQAEVASLKTNLALVMAERDRLAGAQATPSADSAPSA